MPDTAQQQTNRPVALPVTPQQMLEAALKKIPESIATITSVDPPADPQRTAAPRTLVHLRQLHGIGGFDFAQLPKGVLEAAVRLLPQGQKQQQQILDVMTASGGIRRVIAENMDPETVRNFNNGIEQLRGDAGKMLSVIIQRTNADTPEKFRTYLRDNAGSDDPLVQLLQRQGERTWIPLLELRQQVQSDFLLHATFRGRIELVSGEDPALHAATVDYLRRHPGATMGQGGDRELNALQDRREARYLRMIAENKQPVSFLVLGAGHSMREEIAAHNSAHPEDPIRLIEILPRAAAKFLKIAEVKAPDKE